MSIKEKRQWILKKIEEYGDEEDQNIEREEILSYDENVERIYTLFSTKEKKERKNLLEKYKKEADEEQEQTTKEYFGHKKELDRLVQEMKKLVLKFENERQKGYDEKEADEILNNID